MRIPGLFAVALASCAPGFRGPAASETGATFKDLTSRDLTVLPEPRAVVGPAGLFVTKVPATEAPVLEMTEGAARVSWSIGTRESVQCMVYGQRMNVADLLSSALTNVNKLATAARLEDTDAGELAGEPFLAFAVLYGSNSCVGSDVGELKLIAVAHHALSFICTHDEPGYHGAFQRAVGAFTHNLVVITDSERPQPEYRGIHRISKSDTRVGFIDSWTETLQGDEIAYNSSLALLRVQSDNTLVGLDMDTYEVADASNHLLEARYVSIENHNELANIELSQKDAKVFNVYGSCAGRAVRAELAPVQGMFGEYGQARLIAESVARGDRAWSAPTFDPLRPDAVQEVSFALSGSEEGGLPLVTVKRSDRDLQIAVDPHGHPTVIFLPNDHGRARLIARRVWSVGEPAQ